MGDNKWSAADIFKARILDAWDRYPNDARTNRIVDKVTSMLYAANDLELSGNWEYSMTNDASALLDKARKEGVL